MDNKTELLKKLKALADAGVDGERDNAQKILDRLLKKYDLTLADIEFDEIKEHAFQFRGKQEREILKQICFKVTDGDRRVYHYRTGIGSKNTICCECSDAEAIQIRFEFDFYKELWEEELKLFLTAFIVKHEIFDSKPANCPSTLSAEERMRLHAMVMGLADKRPARLLPE